MGLRAVVALNEEGDLSMSFTQKRRGAMTASEAKACDIFEAEAATSSAEMLATMLERIAQLVPVDCEDCGIATDVPGLIRELRKGAVVS
ncbi:hypothetical protein [Sorangium sp. So ce1024]|uniref:hypothetical protein n=1 Tax=Sorangium sp. So ce1024 TaxID=3133327 RepID=UPI003F02CD35